MFKNKIKDLNYIIKNSAILFFIMVDLRPIEGKWVMPKPLSLKSNIFEELVMINKNQSF